MSSTHQNRPFVPIAVLVSGRGTNLEAVLEAIEKKYITNGAVKVVISNKPDAPALNIARKHNVPTEVLDDQGLPKTSWEYDQKTIRLLQENGVTHKDGLILLAGYFRILSPEFVELYASRIFNIHPSLLPAFPGLNAQRQALDHGAKVTGCTVHFANKGVDSGPIILQTAVPVRDDDTVETLSQRILREEHRLYPEAVRLFTEGRLTVKGRRVSLVE
jgi:phosphoribosylglycinamide formyltransferase 1